MRHTTVVFAISPLFIAQFGLASANDALRCLDLVLEERFEAARPVCRNLELNDPYSAQALAYYELYVEVGSERLQQIALYGIDEATLEEKRKIESAKKLFVQAAEAGYPEAQFMAAMTIGMLAPREARTGAPQESGEEIYWLEKAAEGDNVEANYLLGIKAFGPLDSVLVNPDRLPYLQRAAELGHPEARAKLAKYTAANRAAESGDPVAMRKRAIELSFSPSGDKDEADRLMRLAADGGDVEAMQRIGLSAWPEDPATTREYLQKAADEGSSQAMMALGNLGACEGDADAAGTWFRAAQERGHPEAEYAIAELNEWGIDEWDCRRL